MWLLLLVQGIGFIAAVTIVCYVSLFSTVATTASLQETLNARTDTSTMTLNTTTQSFSSKIYTDVQKQLDPMVQQYIGAYLDHPALTWIGLCCTGSCMCCCSADNSKCHFAAIYVPHITTQRGLGDRNRHGTLTTTLIRDNMSKNPLQAGIEGRIFYDD